MLGVPMKCACKLSHLPGEIGGLLIGMQKASFKPFKEDTVQWFRALWKDYCIQQRTRGRRYRGWGLEGRLGMQGNQPTEFSGHMRSVAYSRAIDVECKLPDRPAECADGDFEGGVIDKRHWLQ